MRKRRDEEVDPEAEDSSPAEKSVSGPPEDKSFSKPAVRPCPNCGAPLKKYEGPSAQKQGRDECDGCGRHFTN